jgi:hypothetical protein
MKTTLCFLFWLCVTALLFPGGAVASFRVTVSDCSGQAYRLTNDTEAPLREGQTLVLGDTVRTGPDGKVVLCLEDGSAVELFADSALTLDETMSHWGEECGFSLNQLFGTLIARIKSLRGDDLVVTPSLSLGIRGTRFLVSVADDGASVVSVDSGTVSASTADAPDVGADIPVSVGQEVLALQPGKLLVPRPVSIATPEQATAFREQRLRAFLPVLPEKISELDDKMDALLVDLGILRSGILQQLELLGDSRRRARQSMGREARGEALRDLRRDSEQVRIQLRRFWLGAMRGKGIFRRARRLETLLPRYAEQTGATTLDLQKQLTAFLERRGAVRQEITAMAQEIRDAWRPFRQLFSTMGPRSGNRQHPRRN